ncbi:DUF6894 family protein [Sphingomonas sp.]|uniref:DUF6894 family protein n=1 Tax=Sphingomonas sp. TaxID=28214 RepID=UPI003B3AD55E
MPRFSITAHRGAEDPDTSWVELPDFAAARREAVRFAGELLIDAGSDFDGVDWIVAMRDEAGCTVFTINVLWTAAPDIDRRGDSLTA